MIYKSQVCDDRSLHELTCNELLIGTRQSYRDSKKRIGLDIHGLRIHDADDAERLAQTLAQPDGESRRPHTVLSDSYLSVRRVTHLAHLVNALRYTYGIPRQPTAVRYVTHLAHLVSALRYKFVTPRQPTAVRCVTDMAHLVRELRYTFGTSSVRSFTNLSHLVSLQQCVALHIWHTSSVSCVTHLAPRQCVALQICHTSAAYSSAFRYTFGTPCQCVALHSWDLVSALRYTFCHLVSALSYTFGTPH
jgi:hypothetical protein